MVVQRNVEFPPDLALWFSRHTREAPSKQDSLPAAESEASMSIPQHEFNPSNGFESMVSLVLEKLRQQSGAAIALDTVASVAPTEYQRTRYNLELEALALEGFTVRGSEVD